MNLNPKTHRPYCDGKWLYISYDRESGIYQCNMSYAEILSALADNSLMGALYRSNNVGEDFEGVASFTLIESINPMYTDEEYRPTYVATIAVNTDSTPTLFILEDGSVTAENPNSNAPS